MICIRLATGLLTVSLASLPVQSETLACPLSQLTQRLAETPKNLKTVEVPVAEVQSTEGGVWKVRLSPSGKVHSVQRIDYGETGLGETTLVPMDRQNVAIRDVMITYREPIGSG